MRPLLIVFARAPVAGRVKTRLVPPLTPQQAAVVHTAFTADTIETLGGFSYSADVELHTDQDTTAWDWLKVRRFVQPEGSLAERMLRTMEASLAAGRPQVGIFGSDSPSLPRAHVSVLLESEADVSFGPCEDGGFYAVVCRRTDPGMFRNVRWSTAHALEDALAAAQRCGLTTWVGTRWFDVDTAPDLKRLDSYLPPRYTLKALERLSLIPRRRRSSIPS